LLRVLARPAAVPWALAKESTVNSEVLTADSGQPPHRNQRFQRGPRRVGKLRLNEWTTKDGERGSRIQVVADAVQFFGSPRGIKPSADDAAEPADKPAVGAYRRKAS
jgi:hypothetical protein